MTLIMIATAIAIIIMLITWTCAMNEDLNQFWYDSVWSLAWNVTLPDEVWIEIDVSEFDQGTVEGWDFMLFAGAAINGRVRALDREFAASHIAHIQARIDARTEGRDLGLKFRLAELRHDTPRSAEKARLAREIRSENATLTPCTCDEGWDSGDLCPLCEGMGHIDLSSLQYSKTEVLIDDPGLSAEENAMTHFLSLGDEIADEDEMWEIEEAHI